VTSVVAVRDDYNSINFDICKSLLPCVPWVLCVYSIVPNFAFFKISRTMDIPVEIIQAIGDIFIQSTMQTWSDTNFVFKPRKPDFTDLNNLAYVSKYFLDHVRKVKYKSVLIGSDCLTFIARNHMCHDYHAVDVSFDDFNDFLKFTRDSRLVFDIAKFIKIVKLDIDDASLDMFEKLGQTSHYNLESLDVREYTNMHCDLQLNRKRVYTTIDSLGLLQLKTATNFYEKDEIAYCPTSLNIKAIYSSIQNIEFYGIKRLNQFTSIKTVRFEKQGILTNKHLEGFNLQLNWLDLDHYHPLKLSHFECCINTLTRLDIRTHNNYDDLLSFLPKLINLTHLSVGVCRAVPFDFFAKLLKIAVSFENIKVVSVCGENSHFDDLSNNFLYSRRIQWNLANNCIKLFTFEFNKSYRDIQFSNVYDKFLMMAIDHFIHGKSTSLFQEVFKQSNVPYSILCNDYICSSISYSIENG